MADLPRLANLLHKCNNVDSEIAALIGRPAHIGHIAEYVAAAIFALPCILGLLLKRATDIFGMVPEGSVSQYQVR